MTSMSAQAALVPVSEPWPEWNVSDESNASAIDHGLWQQILDTYLVSDDPSGINLFRYSAVSQADSDKLDNYLASLTSIDPRTYNKAEQRAYWINLYNAVTVRLILDYYPVKSIRKVEGGLFGLGPWNEEVITIAGQKMTLNDIEHRILRPVYQDPRTHYAVNCASRGCPNLASEAYRSDNMETLLNNGARAFINHPRGAELDGDKLQLSSIYKWFSVDFGPDEQALLQHLRQYAEPELAASLQDFDGRFRYDYDWDLNEP